MADASSAAAANTLGLDFDQLKISQAEDTPSEEQDKSEEATSRDSPKKKGSQYVNPERVKTGGTPRDKLTDEALSERMARIKEQNEKIKQRRLDVQADVDAFRQTQETERLKHDEMQRVQSDINRAREQNAKRKMDKVQSREWDSSKPGATDQRQTSETAGNTSTETGGWRGRGSPRARGRGRGRGRGERKSQTDKPAELPAKNSTEETI